MMSVLFRLLEVALGVLALLFFIMQVVMPLARGRAPFPMFRRGPKIERELQAANEEADNRKLERELKATRKKNR